MHRHALQKSQSSINLSNNYVISRRYNVGQKKYITVYKICVNDAVANELKRFENEFRRSSQRVCPKVSSS